MLLLVMIPLVGCSGGAAAPSEAATPTPIATPIVPTKPTYEVQRGEVVKSVQFTGRVAPVVEQALFFRTAGYVANVLVKRNDLVKKGDLIAELEVTDLKNHLAESQAALDSAESNNEQRVAEAQAQLTTAQLNLSKLKVQDPSLDTTMAEVALERAQTGLADAQKEYDDAKHRYWQWKYDEVKDAYTRSLHEAELNLKVVQAQYNKALEAAQAHQYDVQIQEQAVNLAQMRLDQAKSGLDITQLQLVVKTLQSQLADAQLVAPFDGQVMSLSITEGRSVDAYREVAILADPKELEISADLTDKVLTDLAEGMSVTAALVSRPDETLSGEIRRLPYPYGGGGRQGTDVQDEDKSTRVSINSSSSSVQYEDGDLVRVTVVLERKSDVLWLPPQAIRTFSGRKFVVVQEGDGQRRVDVKIGIESEDRVEIEEGLQEGQIVIGQ